MIVPIISLFSKAGYVAGVMTGGAVVIEGIKAVTEKFAPSFAPQIAGPANLLQSAVDYFDMAGFQGKRKAAIAGLISVPESSVSGSMRARRNAYYRAAKAKKDAEKEQDSAIALQKVRWAELTEKIAALSASKESEGDNAAAEALGKVALELARNAGKPPSGPQFGLASTNIPDATKSLMTDLFDAVNRTTEEPDYDSLVARIENPAAVAIEDNEDEDEDDDDSADFITAGASKKSASKKRANKKIEEAASRTPVAGCCGPCSAGKGSCGSLAGEGVPGEYIDGFGMFGPEDDDDYIAGHDEDEDEDGEDFTESLGW